MTVSHFASHSIALNSVVVACNSPEKKRSISKIAFSFHHLIVRCSILLTWSKPYTLLIIKKGHIFKAQCFKMIIRED